MVHAEHVIAALGLEPHPEGGWFRETWREPATTAIFYLLRAGERSHWHRVDATEIWHFYDGDALELSMSEDGHGTARHVLGPDLAAGERPQLVVPAGTWQAARPRGRLDAGRLHRRPRVPVLRLRAGRAGLGARPLVSAP